MVESNNKNNETNQEKPKKKLTHKEIINLPLVKQFSALAEKVALRSNRQERHDAMYSPGRISGQLSIVNMQLSNLIEDLGRSDLENRLLCINWVWRRFGDDRYARTVPDRESKELKTDPVYISLHKLFLQPLVEQSFNEFRGVEKNVRVKLANKHMQYYRHELHEAYVRLSDRKMPEQEYTAILQDPMKWAHDFAFNKASILVEKDKAERKYAISISRAAKLGYKPRSYEMEVIYSRRIRELFGA